VEQLSSWVAPIATAIAACMTAANLGSRVTGWGFVVFTIGSIAWTTYGATTGQSNLLWQNLFLTAVNLLGVWRWLGRQAKLDDGARAAAEQSADQPGPTLFPVSLLTRAPVEARDGESLGSTVEAMARCDNGRITYLVIGKGGVGGVGETLHAVHWDQVRVTTDRVTTQLGKDEIDALPPIDPSEWPTRPHMVSGVR
jgi:hypothetical protein